MPRGVRSTVVVALLLLSSAAEGARQVWFVPWKVLEPGVEAKPSLLAVYWIPASSEELRRSDLLTSRALTTYSGRCVAMHVVRIDDTVRIARFAAATLPIVVLADGDRELARLPSGHATVRASDVEAMVRSEFDERAAAAEGALDEARGLLERGDHAAAVALYQRVAQQRCAFPREGKAARRALRKLGR
jgi:hypothetical protein